MRARELLREMRRAGAELMRRDGDHHVYVMPGGERVALPMGGRQGEVCSTLIRRVRAMLDAVSDCAGETINRRRKR